MQTASTPGNIAAVVGNAMPGLRLSTNQTGNFGQALRANYTRGNGSRMNLSVGYSF